MPLRNACPPVRNVRRSFTNLKIKDLKSTNRELYAETIKNLDFKLLNSMGSYPAGTILSCQGGIVSGVNGRSFTDSEWFSPMLPMSVITKLRAAGHDVKITVRRNQTANSLTALQ